MFQSLKLLQKSIDFRMVFKAKNGPKRPELWFWPMPRTSMHPLKVVGHRSLPIFGSYGFEKKFQPNKAELTSPTSKGNWIFQWFCKIFWYFNTAFWAPKQCSTSGYRPNRWIYHKKFDRFCTFSAHFWSWCMGISHIMESVISILLVVLTSSKYIHMIPSLTKSIYRLSILV